MKTPRKLNAVERDRCSKRLGPYDEQRLKALIAEGKNNTEIAKLMGFSRVTITAARKRLYLGHAKNGRPVGAANTRDDRRRSTDSAQPNGA